MEKFNDTYKKFFEQLKIIVPELSKDSTYPENSLTFFTNQWYPHIEEASKANLDYFLNKDLNIFEKLKFSELMKNISIRNQWVVWEYIHSLYIISISMKENKGKIDSDKYPMYIANMVDWKKERKEPEEPERKFDDIFENSSLSKLAKEISEDLKEENIDELKKTIENPAEIFQALLTGNENGIGGLVKKVSTKINDKIQSGELKHDDLFKEANTLLGTMMKDMGNNKENAPNINNIMKMFGNLGNFSEMFKNTNSKHKKKKNKKKQKNNH